MTTIRKMSCLLSSLVILLPAVSIAQDFDAVEITTTPIRNGIYMLQGSGGNIGVSVGDDGVLIVDDQFAPLTEKISAAIGELSDQSVKFVVNSHFHFDHTDGNENFGRAGAYIIAQDNARKRMESTQVLAGSGRVQEAYEDVGLPTMTFDESMHFYFNDNAIDMLNTGDGHTDGDVQVYFREANVIHTGDMFVRYFPPFVDQSNGGSLDGMIDAAMELASIINDETIIIPGHGPLSNRDDLLEFREKLVVIRGNLVRAKVQGLSPADMLATNPGAEYAPRNESNDAWLLRAYDEYR